MKRTKNPNQKLKNKTKNKKQKKAPISEQVKLLLIHKEWMRCPERFDVFVVPYIHGHSLSRFLYGVRERKNAEKQPNNAIKTNITTLKKRTNVKKRKSSSFTPYACVIRRKRISPAVVRT
jgi:hypothetical protein